MLISIHYRYILRTGCKSETAMETTIEFIQDMVVQIWIFVFEKVFK